MRQFCSDDGGYNRKKKFEYILEMLLKEEISQITAAFIIWHHYKKEKWFLSRLLSG